MKGLQVLHILPAWFSRPRCRPYLLILFAGVVALACMTPGALLAIGGYQRWVSPYKGYRCAHGALYGTSCSEFGEQAIQDYGLIGGLILLRQQFRDCSDAAARIRSRPYRASGIQPQGADVCFETDRERGRRESEQTLEYCAGCFEGCCGE